ncbi:hypothetical protein [Plantactinospora sp. KLBMP9567]|uniref:hypothetical protein n=1 Tax=Plantactinospora sp. KLBMP9567 TaxID=3085900 RepID=UPI0029827C4D|nr:hypothetical protein [Plantactinospora sp. KLBMP9567]MDW5330766.1 hypothetical protein [Plantactinospora sp. KLBMP9567]
MAIDNDKTVDLLRGRGHQVMADWIDRELPDRVDGVWHASPHPTGLDPAGPADRASR